MARTGMQWSDNCFIFRPIQKTKNGESLRETGRISYSCLKDLFKNKVSKLGYDAADFGLHSLRAGGATAAANAGVPDQLWGLFYGTERNGTERNDGLNHGTERFLKLKLATYHC